MAAAVRRAAASVAGGLPPRATYATLRAYGGLKDQDRIFTNLYGKHDFGIKGALKRVRRSLSQRSRGKKNVR
jgi:NADH dehydrogenase (ubiquinone) flavoprotein 1